MLEKYKKHFKFRKAQLKIKEELDVVNIIRQLRIIQGMMQSYFNPMERLALLYQKQNVLDTDDTEDEEHFKDKELQKKLEKKDQY